MVRPTVQSGRDGDEVILHAPPGGEFRVIEAARERDPLAGRQLLEDFGLLLLGQVFEDRDGIVGLELAHAFGDGLCRQLFEDLLAHGVVDFGERREIENRAPSPRPAAAVIADRAPQSKRRPSASCRSPTRSRRACEFATAIASATRVT